MVLCRTYLVLGGHFRDHLEDGPFKLLDADVLEDDRSLGEQPHVRGHLLTLEHSNKNHSVD